MPQVGIIDSAASGAHRSHAADEAEIMWNFPNDKKQKKCCHRFKASWILSEMISLFGNSLMNSSVLCPQKRNCCLFLPHNLEKKPLSKQITADGVKMDRKTMTILFL